MTNPDIASVFAPWDHEETAIPVPKNIVGQDTVMTRIDNTPAPNLASSDVFSFDGSNMESSNGNTNTFLIFDNPDPVVKSDLPRPENAFAIGNRFGDSQNTVNNADVTGSGGRNANSNPFSIFNNPDPSSAPLPNSAGPETTFVNSGPNFISSSVTNTVNDSPFSYLGGGSVNGDTFASTVEAPIDLSQLGLARENFPGTDGMSNSNSTLNDVLATTATTGTGVETLEIVRPFPFGNVQDGTQTKPSMNVVDDFVDNSRKPLMRMVSKFVDMSGRQKPKMAQINGFVDQPEEPATSPNPSDLPTVALKGIGLPGTLTNSGRETVANSNRNVVPVNKVPDVPNTSTDNQDFANNRSDSIIMDTPAGPGIQSTTPSIVPDGEHLVVDMLYPPPPFPSNTVVNSNTPTDTPNVIPDFPVSTGNRDNANVLNTVSNNNPNTVANINNVPNTNVDRTRMENVNVNLNANTQRGVNTHPVDIVSDNIDPTVESRQRPNQSPANPANNRIPLRPVDGNQNRGSFMTDPAVQVLNTNIAPNNQMTGIRQVNGQNFQSAVSTVSNVNNADINGQQNNRGQNLWNAPGFSTGGNTPQANVNTEFGTSDRGAGSNNIQNVGLTNSANGQGGSLSTQQDNRNNLPVLQNGNLNQMTNNVGGPRNGQMESRNTGSNLMPGQIPDGSGVFNVNNGQTNRATGVVPNNQNTLGGGTPDLRTGVNMQRNNDGSVVARNFNEQPTFLSNVPDQNAGGAVVTNSTRNRQVNPSTAQNIPGQNIGPVPMNTANVFNQARPVGSFQNPNPNSNIQPSILRQGSGQAGFPTSNRNHLTATNLTPNQLNQMGGQQFVNPQLNNGNQIDQKGLSGFPNQNIPNNINSQFPNSQHKDQTNMGAGNTPAVRIPPNQQIPNQGMQQTVLNSATGVTMGTAGQNIPRNLPNFNNGINPQVGTLPNVMANAQNNAPNAIGQNFPPNVPQNTVGIPNRIANAQFQNSQNSQNPFSTGQNRFSNTFPNSQISTTEQGLNFRNNVPNNMINGFTPQNNFQNNRNPMVNPQLNNLRRGFQMQNPNGLQGPFMMNRNVNGLGANRFPTNQANQVGNFMNGPPPFLNGGQPSDFFANEQFNQFPPNRPMNMPLIPFR